MNNLTVSSRDPHVFALHEGAVVRQLPLSGRNSRKDAFSVTCRLPPEVLATIFSYCVSDHHHRRGRPAEGAPSWIGISYVCRHWRNVALNFPSLWGHIYITSPRWTEVLLARSRQASLKVRGVLLFSDDDPTWDSVEKVLLHRERIQELHMVLPAECADLLFTKLFSSRTPRLQKLQISASPDGSSTTFEVHGDTPALRTLQLSDCPAPWYSFNLGTLTCLNLYHVPAQFQQDTATFLTTLSSMRNLKHVYLEHALASAADFLSSTTSRNRPRVGLPNLSRLLIVAPVSTVVAFLTCVDVPLKTELRLKCRLEASSSDDYKSVSSLVSQRFRASGDQAPHSPAIRSLHMTIVEGYAMLSFATSLERYSDDTYEAWGCDIPLKIIVQFERPTTPEDKNHIATDMCRRMPLKDVVSLCVHCPPFSPTFWENVLGQLPAVHRIRLVDGHMPDLASVLAIPGDATNGDRRRVVAPALKEVELERIAFSLSERVPGVHSILPAPMPAIKEDKLFAALYSRRHHDGRLVMKRCRFGRYKTVCYADPWHLLKEQK